MPQFGLSATFSALDLQIAKAIKIVHSNELAHDDLIANKIPSDCRLHHHNHLADIFLFRMGSTISDSRGCPLLLLLAGSIC